MISRVTGVVQASISWLEANRELSLDMGSPAVFPPDAGLFFSRKNVQKIVYILFLKNSKPNLYFPTPFSFFLTNGNVFYHKYIPEPTPHTKVSSHYFTVITKYKHILLYKMLAYNFLNWYLLSSNYHTYLKIYPQIGTWIFSLGEGASTNECLRFPQVASRWHYSSSIHLAVTNEGFIFKVSQVHNLDTGQRTASQCFPSVQLPNSSICKGGK